MWHLLTFIDFKLNLLGDNWEGKEKLEDSMSDFYDTIEQSAGQETGGINWTNYYDTINSKGVLWIKKLEINLPNLKLIVMTLLLDSFP